MNGLQMMPKKPSARYTRLKNRRMYFKICSQTVKNFEKVTEIAKMRNINSFPTVYQLHQSDLGLKSY